MINVADVIAEYGAYYLKSGQNKQSLYKRFYRPSTTAAYFAPRPTGNTVWQLGSAEIDRVLQPFQKQFTPIGTLTFKPNPIQLFRLKIDKAEYPDDIAESWLGFLEGDGIDRKQWPFIRWMIEQHIMPKAAEDHELNEVFAGVAAAPTAGTAGAAGTAMNGIKKLQDDLVTAGRITPIVMTDPATLVTDDLFCSEVEKFVEALPTVYRRKIDYIFMNEDLELRYRKGKRLKYNINYEQEPNLETIANFPNAKVVGLPSHNGSKRVWTSLPGVRVRPLKKASLSQFLQVEGVDRQVKLYTDWYEGMGYTFPEMVFINSLA